MDEVKVKRRGAEIEPLLTTEDVADMLRCSADTVLRYARERGLPRIQVGRKTRFRHKDVADWLEVRRVVQVATVPLVETPGKAAKKVKVSASSPSAGATEDIRTVIRRWKPKI